MHTVGGDDGPEATKRFFPIKTFSANKISFGSNARCASGVSIAKEEYLEGRD